MNLRSYYHREFTFILSIMDHNSQWLISLRLKPPAGEETHEVPNPKRWGKKGPCPILIKLLSREPFLAHQVLDGFTKYSPQHTYMKFTCNILASDVTFPSQSWYLSHRIPNNFHCFKCKQQTWMCLKVRDPQVSWGMIISCDEINYHFEVFPPSFKQTQTFAATLMYLRTPRWFIFASARWAEASPA